MASAAVVSSASSRRLHYQSQIANTSSNPLVESTAFTDSFSLSSISIIPLVTIVYSNASSSPENQQLLLNSYATCRRLLDHMKQIIGIPHDETIDLIDNEGKLKELHTHSEEYATQFLTARSTYYILKIEVDSVTGEKRYTPNFYLEHLDQKLSTILTNALNTLNKSTNKPKRATGTSRQNASAQSSSSTTHAKTKRAANRK